MINALIQSTKAGLLDWTKGRTSLSYTACPPPGHLIHLDKYYFIVNEQPNPCLNFTLFTSSNEIVDELILYKEGDDPLLFDLLGGLYKEVEIQYTRNTNPTLPVVLADITRALTDQFKGL